MAYRRKRARLHMRGITDLARRAAHLDIGLPRPTKRHHRQHRRAIVLRYPGLWGQGKRLIRRSL